MISKHILNIIISVLKKQTIIPNGTDRKAERVRDRGTKTNKTEKKLLKQKHEAKEKTDQKTSYLDGSMKYVYSILTIATVKCLKMSRRLKLHLSVYRKRRLVVITTVDKCLLFRWVTAYFMFSTGQWNKTRSCPCSYAQNMRKRRTRRNREHRQRTHKTGIANQLEKVSMHESLPFLKLFFRRPIEENSDQAIERLEIRNITLLIVLSTVIS